MDNPRAQLAFGFMDTREQGVPPFARARTGTLCEKHRTELSLSGLTDDTLRRHGLYTESNPYVVERILNWGVGSLWEARDCLVIPFFDLNGNQTNFARVKPSFPREVRKPPTKWAKRERQYVKYEQPRGVPVRPYFPLDALAAIHDPQRPVYFTEGEKKALCASQFGFPCIGLPGVSCWSRARPKDDDGKSVGERRLHPLLRQISWNGRIVRLVFDTDGRRNPQVNREQAELAAELSCLGAIVEIVELPPGKRDSLGAWTKMGLDDFLVNHGADAFERLVRSTKRRVDTLEQRRLQLVDSFQVGRPRLFVTEAHEKIAATFAFAKSAGLLDKRAVVVRKDHELCVRSVRVLEKLFVSAAKYPALNKDTCKNFKKAQLAMGWGLPVSASVCPRCHWRVGCLYHLLMEKAQASDCRVATVARAQIGFVNLMGNAGFGAIYEDALKVLRPTYFPETTFERVAAFADYAWQNVPDLASACFFRKMNRHARYFEQLIHCDGTFRPVRYPRPVGHPPQIYQTLFEKLRGFGGRIDRAALQFCLAVMFGQVDSMIRYAYGDGARLMAVGAVQIPADASVGILDPTETAESLEEILGIPVSVIGSPPHSLRRKEVIQIPRDITRRTSPAVVTRLVEAVLSERPHARRVVLLGHKNHAQVLPGLLAPEFRQRVRHVGHFFGESIADCIPLSDLVLVLGTPRISPEAIREEVLRRSYSSAAARDGEWGKDWWSGIDQEGRRTVVQSLGYRDRDWQDAYDATILRQLWPLIRSSGDLNEDAVPIVIFSNHQLDVPVRSHPLRTHSELERKLLELLDLLASDAFESSATHMNPSRYRRKRDLLGKMCVSSFRIVSTNELAEAAGCTPKRARELLARMAVRGEIERVGKRIGWRPLPRDESKEQS